MRTRIICYVSIFFLLSLSSFGQDDMAGYWINKYLSRYLCSSQPQQAAGYSFKNKSQRKCLEIRPLMRNEGYIL
jgi:hypothetical protein